MNLDVVPWVSLAAAVLFLLSALLVTFPPISMMRSRVSTRGEGWKMVRLLHFPDFGWAVSGTSTGAISAHPLRGARALCMLARRCSARPGDGRIAGESCVCGFHAVYSIQYPMMEELRYNEHASRCFQARVRLSGSVTFSQHAFRGERQDVLEMRLPERCVGCSREPKVLVISSSSGAANSSCGSCRTVPASRAMPTSWFIDSEGKSLDVPFTTDAVFSVEEVAADLARQGVTLCYADGHPVPFSEDDRKRVTVAADAAAWLSGLPGTAKPSWVVRHRGRIADACNASRQDAEAIIGRLIDGFAATDIEREAPQAVALLHEASDRVVDDVVDAEDERGRAWRRLLGVEVGDRGAYTDMVASVHGPAAGDLVDVWLRAPASIRIKHPIDELERTIEQGERSLVAFAVSLSQAPRDQ